MHPDLLRIKKYVYEPIGLHIRNLRIENESTEYGAAEFTIDSAHVKNGHIKNGQVKFRVAKITPTKVGQFVTFWKRIGKKPIMPYAFNDPFDFLVVSVTDVGVCSEKHFGQFVFPKKVLCEKGIVSSEEKQGKRAMRVYPSWDKPDNPQARKTQTWQLEWFIETPDQSPDQSTVDLARIEYLLSCK